MAASLETNKTLAALLTAGIIASGSGVVSRMLYHPHVPEENAYVIEVPEAAAQKGEAAAAEAAPLPVLLAQANPEKGASEAKKCAACHSEEKGGPIKIGPPLWGVVGRNIASVEGFEYSDALRGKEGRVDLREHLRVHPWPERMGSGHQDGIRRDQEPRGPGRPPGLSAHARGSARAAARGGSGRGRAGYGAGRCQRAGHARRRAAAPSEQSAAGQQPAASEPAEAGQQTAAAEPAAPAAASEQGGAVSRLPRSSRPRPKVPRRPVLRQPAPQAGSPLCSPMPIPTPAPRTRENAPPVTTSTRVVRPSSARRSGA